MSMTESYITILDASLNKKIEILDEIILINSRQSELIAADKPDADAFNETVEEKAVLIDKLNELDEGFQLLYNNVQAELKDNRERYLEQIAQMQKKITLIMEKSTHIQTEEKRNNERIKAMFGSLHKAAKTVKKNSRQVANYYKTMNKLTDEPVFMDRKK